MNEEQLNKENRFQQVIFWLMFFGSGFVLVLLVYLLGNGKISNPVITSDSDPFLIPIIAIIIGILLGSMLISRKMLPGIKRASTEEKLPQYRKLVILKLAMIESTVIIAAVIFYLTGIKDYSYLALAMLLMLRIQKPSIIKLKRDLDLN